MTNHRMFDTLIQDDRPYTIAEEIQDNTKKFPSRLAHEWFCMCSRALGGLANLYMSQLKSQVVAISLEYKQH